jgi:murein DD-endopeptidase MepM/ murein hydrolase activator NlpD
MQKHTTSAIFRCSTLRTRAAVVAAGLGVSVALGAGVAVAADVHQASFVVGTSSVENALTKQADGQGQAAAKAAAAKAAAAKAAAAKAKAAAAKAAAAKAQKAANAWVSPVDRPMLGEPFGIAGHLWAHKHSGQDFVCPSGTAVKAVHRGTVVKAGPYGGGDGPAYGNAIVIEHNGHTYSQYAHLSEIDVHIGQSVRVGQVIARSGATGNVTGPHLHFEMRTTPDYGSGYNPLFFLRAHHVTL